MMQIVISVVILCFLLNASATWALVSQAGFISIDCGAPSAYVDAITGISWVPDADYITVGTNFANVQGSVVNYPNNSEITTLRYFTEPRNKYCYVLPGLVLGSTYLIRHSYFWGAYDGSTNAPTFQTAIDSTSVFTISFDSATADLDYRYEHIYQAKGTSISFCLYRNSTTGLNPFISALELRPAPAGYNYPTVNDGNFLSNFYRKNYGSSPAGIVRFPDDEYDRLWYGDEEVGLTHLSSPSPVITSTLSLKPPSLVMQTAQTSPTIQTIIFPFGLGGSPLQTELILYFAELDSSATLTSCIFTVNADGFRPFTENIYKDVGAFSAVSLSYSNWTLGAAANISLIPVTGSIQPPFLNAAEVYLYYPTQTPPTFAADAAAIAIIESDLNLTSWGGDPCLPVSLDWITCTQASPPRVIAVKLSNFNLTGEIPVAFANLTALTTLWLDNNDLTGSVPAALGTLPVLAELLLDNNNLTGTIPASLKKPGLTLNVRGNPGIDDPGVNSSPLGPTAAPSKAPSSPSKSSNVGIIAGVLGAVAGIVLIGSLVIIFCVCKSHLEPKSRNDSENVSNQTKNTVSNQTARAFSLLEIKSATSNFNKKIGQGGFGPVYYGKLQSGQEVAVKVSDARSHQGAHEFNNEVELLSRIHHKNLVSLIGYCQEDNQQMLIYEFLHKGTVSEHLYGSPLAIKEGLDWKTRLTIALDAAQGLEYLHTGCNPNIIHRDIKSSNILLNNKCVAKVADFGLSKLAPEEGATHVSTLVKGTAGYLDPEYFSTNELTEKSDVYSFGVVLLEILCGRAPIEPTLSNQNHRLINDWARSSLQAGNIESILDGAITSSQPNMDSVWKVAEIAMQSIEPKGIHRPLMVDVVRELREAINLEGGNSTADFSDMSTIIGADHTGSHQTRKSSMSSSSYPDMTESSMSFPTNDNSMFPQPR